MPLVPEGIKDHFETLAPLPPCAVHAPTVIAHPDLWPLGNSGLIHWVSFWPLIITLNRVPYWVRPTGTSWTRGSHGQGQPHPEGEQQMSLLATTLLPSIIEANLPQNNQVTLKRVTFLHSGGPYRTHDVSLNRQPLAQTLTTGNPISPCLLYALQHHHGQLSVIVVHVPMENASSIEKDACYHQVSAKIQSAPPHDILLVLRDFNAVTGSDRTGYETMICPFGSGFPNDNTT